MRASPRIVTPPRCCFCFSVPANRGLDVHFSDVLLGHSGTLDLLESTVRSEELKTVATVSANVVICEIILDERRGNQTCVCFSMAAKITLVQT